MATFVDTNVVVYAFDGSTGEKHERAKEVLASDPSALALSTQVLSEFYVTVTRKFRQPLAADVARDAVRALSRLTVVPIESETIVSAIEIAEAHRISYWDAQIVAAAVRGGCETLVSEDLNDGQVVAGVEIVNPFRPA